MKYLLFTLLCIAQYISTEAQSNKPKHTDTNKTEIFEINPFGADLGKVYLKYGSKVKFKITNVNPFKIQGTNSVTRQTISFDVPAQFSQPLAQPKTDDSEKQPALVERNKWSALITESFHGDTKNIPKSEIDSLKKIIQELISINSLKNQFITNYNCFIATLNQLSVYTSIDSYIDSLLQETFIPDTITLRSNLDAYMQSINYNDANINSLRDKCRAALNNFTNCYINAKSAYDELAKKIKDEKLKVTGQLATADNDVTLKVDSAFFTFEREKFFEKEFQFITEKFTAINPEKKRTEILNKTNAGVDYYFKVHNAKFEVYTDAQQIDDDLIEITPKLKNSKGEIVKEFNPVKIKSCGGLKVDFSSGYLLSFKGDENYTNLYDSTGIIGVQKNKTDNLKHSIGALFNVYPRTGKDINMGISFGISIPTDGTGVGFYGGVSALMLEKNRLVISAGIAYNKIKLLNTGNLLKDNNATNITGKETYKFSNKDFKEIKYDELYRPAFFIGLTYNIFSVKKQQ